MSDIERTPVSSSNINAIGHCPKTNTLAVEFKDGSVYHYNDVPADVHQSLIGSRSIGGFIHANIKGKYSHSKQ